MERNVVFPAQKHTVYKEIIVAVLLLSHLQLLLAGSFFKLDEFKSLLSQLRLREFRMGQNRLKMKKRGKHRQTLLHV